MPTRCEPQSDAFLRQPTTGGHHRLDAELAPFFDQAKLMFGVLVNPTMTPSNIAVKRVADEFGFGDTFRMADVGATSHAMGAPSLASRSTTRTFVVAAPVDRAACNAASA